MGVDDDQSRYGEDWQPMEGREHTAVSPPLTRRRARSWALVLSSRQISWAMEERNGEWRLLVPIAQVEKAHREITLYERENRHWPPPLPQPNPLADNILITCSALGLLAIFHNLTRLDIALLGHDPVPWLNLGDAHAAKIMQGEWWRLVTALTLHADLRHLAGNVFLGGVVIVRLARDLGSGLTWCLLLAAGALGNLINAFVQDPAHRAVGASTAVFAAVGLLAVVGLVRYRLRLWRRWPIPLAAGAALLALLGTGGERTDLGAHLFGFLVGMGLGWIAGRYVSRHGRPGPDRSVLLSLLAALTVVGSWFAALCHGG